MDLLLLSAGILALTVGLVHSVLGERLIFKKLRGDQMFPTQAHGKLSAGNVRILWATWHIVSLLGAAIGLVIILFALAPDRVVSANDILIVLAAALLLSSLTVFIATRGRHLGWLGLLITACLLMLAKT